MFLGMGATSSVIQAAGDPAEESECLTEGACRTGEDEPGDTRSHCFLQQDHGSRHIRFDESAAVVGTDMRLMKGRGMED